MINSALCAARNILRRRLGTRPNGEELVHVASPGGLEGQRNYLGIMFIGLEQESNLQNEKGQGYYLDANAVFMVFSSFADYGESLRHLSTALDAFHAHTRVMPSDFPELKLPESGFYIEPYFFPLVQQLQTWNPFMDDSIPFMFYKLRSLRYGSVRRGAPVVKGVGTETRHGS